MQGKWALTARAAVLRPSLPVRSSVRLSEDDPFAVELGGGLLTDHTVMR